MRRFIQCDVFSDQPLRGNGLAVVLDAEGLSAVEMQRFAVWTNQAETTFLLPPKNPKADYAVRIFSPTKEMAFAGHPTLGSCAAWRHAGGVPKAPGRVIQECQIGPIEVDCSGPVPAFVAPPTTMEPIAPATLARICAALQIERDEIVSSVRLHNGTLRNVIELPDAARVLSLDASAVALPAFEGVSILGRHEFGDADFESRNLTPASMMLEDPITGSMNAAIAVWLKATGRLEKDIVIAQGTALGRQGRVFVSCRGEDILIGGHTTVVIEGTVAI